MSGALNYTGARLCATSNYLPRAYNALLGGALVGIFILVFLFDGNIVLLFRENFVCLLYIFSMSEHPLCDREVVGLIPSRVIPKTLKMVLAALSLGAQHRK